MIDLHIHTKNSDGIMTPKEVIDEAYKKNVKIIAITDHDTLESYTNKIKMSEGQCDSTPISIFQYAKLKGLTLIPAVEMSTRNEKVGIHVLGYNIDIYNDKLNEELHRVRNARHIYLHDVAEKLEKLGYKVNTKELDKIDAVTKAHIALDITANAKNSRKLIDEFGHIPNKGEFIETVMNEGCPAFVKKKTLSPKEASEYIKKAGGKVVLAHPVSYGHEDGLTDEEILKIVKDMNADGIEADYLYVDRNNNKINEILKWQKFAKENNLLVTAGSDFHMKDGLRPEIGFTNTSFKLNENEINDMIINLKL